ncbi:fibrobacter succinogenes major paralogous domain-containing protein [Litoribacter alkaliphilus]|uniref:Fibrobacter succinogenes major paralogous domain-containing protein n=1 Tax=Litoribacter ruber TaxID=702568 RepID=A0AAP2CID5_9BACT|nr:fibrobacter succinogenes major paralogous domain-containing protein [Litoribacter alkaliphilus]MBS9525271.1 fibrobacter succinogenes major paralogous domain-containing protein [Litoribacter alkaliphilus]
MQRFLFIVLITFLFSCTQEVDTESPIGVVKLSGLFVEDFQNHLPASRVIEMSEWIHIYPEEVDLVLTHTGTNESFTISYDPNNFGQGYQFSLPVGDYTYISEVEGEMTSPYLPYSASGNLAVTDQGAELILEATTDYGLLTLNSQEFEQAEVNAGSGYEYFFSLPERNVHYIYIRNGREGTVRATQGEESIEAEFAVGRYQHFHFVPRYDYGNLNVIGLELGEFSLEEHGIPVGGEQLRFIKDNDGNLYKVVRIGDQYWMAENLRSTTFCNGDELTYEPAGDGWAYDEGGFSWVYNTNPIYTYMLNDSSLVKSFGLYYSSIVPMDERNICPCGWKVPSRSDFERLVEYIGGELEASRALRQRGTEYWPYPNDESTDIYGFNAIPAGVVITGSFESMVRGFYFYRLFEASLFWTTTETWSDPGFTPSDPEFTKYDIYSFLISDQTALFNPTGFAVEDLDSFSGINIRCIKE